MRTYQHLWISQATLALNLKMFWAILDHTKWVQAHIIDNQQASWNTSVWHQAARQRQRLSRARPRSQTPAKLPSQCTHEAAADSHGPTVPLKCLSWPQGQKTTHWHRRDSLL